MTSTRLAALLAIALTASACKSDKHGAYETLADRVNPMLIRLVPTIAAISAIVGESPDATDQVISTCTGADTALGWLRSVREDDERIQRDYDDTKPRISEVARWLLESRASYCLPPNGQSHRLTMCRDWCRDMWRDLAEAATRLKISAAKEGVFVVSVSPGAAHE